MKPPRDPDYTVGFKKPPQHTRFQKGQSGNPKGRPKGSFSLATIVNRALKEPITVIGKNGRRMTMCMLEAAFKQQVNKAVKGDAKAMQLVLQLAHLLEEGESNGKATLDADDASVLARLVERFNAPTDLAPANRTSASDKKRGTRHAAHSK